MGDLMCGVIANEMRLRMTKDIGDGGENMAKNSPKKDGSGKGTRANKGRGGCKSTKAKGKGRNR